MHWWKRFLEKAGMEQYYRQKLRKKGIYFRPDASLEQMASADILTQFSGPLKKWDHLIKKHGQRIFGLYNTLLAMLFVGSIVIIHANHLSPMYALISFFIYISFLNLGYEIIDIIPVTHYFLQIVKLALYIYLFVVALIKALSSQGDVAVLATMLVASDRIVSNFKKLKADIRRPFDEQAATPNKHGFSQKDFRTAAKTKQIFEIWKKNEEIKRAQEKKRAERQGKKSDAPMEEPLPKAPVEVPLEEPQPEAPRESPLQTDRYPLSSDNHDK